MRTYSLRQRLSPFSRSLLLAAALLALAVLAVHDGRPAAADHDAATFWSATLTVEDMGGGRYGCNNTSSGDECSSALDDDDITYEGADYDVVSINLRRGALIVTLDKAVPDEMNVLTLQVDDVDLALEDSNPNNDEEMRWLRTGIEWDEGDAVALSLARLPPPTGVTLSKQTLAITEGGSDTFTVALTDDPGSDLTVTLVKAPYVIDSATGAARYGFNKDDVTVSPATLTFTAGSTGNYADPQTVTVTGAQDADSNDEQMIILLMVVSTPAGGGTAPAGDGTSQGTSPVYEPVGGSGNSITGVVVTVDDDDPPGGV